jgi:hypothetical protein
MNERSSVHGEDDRTYRPLLYAKSVAPAEAIESADREWPLSDREFILANDRARSPSCGRRAQLRRIDGHHCREITMKWLGEMGVLNEIPPACNRLQQLKHVDLIIIVYGKMMAIS